MRESERLNLRLFPNWAFLIITMGFVFVLVDISYSEQGPGFVSWNDFTDEEKAILNDPFVNHETKDAIIFSDRDLSGAPSLELELLPDIIGRIGIVAGAFLLSSSRRVWRLGLVSAVGGIVLELVNVFCQLSPGSDSVIRIGNASLLAQIVTDAVVVFALWGGLTMIARQMGYKLIESASLATIILFCAFAILSFVYWAFPTRQLALIVTAFGFLSLPAMGISTYGAMTRL